ncbi:DEAD/DEAH box helicase [Corynebacterium silvaticum]|uniref:DEAD/DEAH box helicase n=1 Tax=Corynebacterium silvaticum TaxID=2320431 RepID=A0A7Y4P9E0_9CORY|nr:DEAD/DEAH box helicase [Corynebacterium silvaticum]ARU45398.1 DEAD/DEAH box helicase [Corynebacterium silvaticum]MBH5299970.1 DEAD/DEAH box helicase [Corynebacterium silvaticum]NOM65506.1 DEAD/DEAH box helicase [Corynebacterium silvaticum]NON70664.1 DEAD/DEAH box helicase [Corynebacterium silvaticum]TFA92297.1 DEAD/DEAH box helicase [Corynebacterium silvaticum]
MAGTNPDMGYQLGQELASIVADRYPNSTCTHLETTPAKPARYAEWPEWVYPPIKEALVNRGIQQLYAHQQEVAHNAWEKIDTVIATGTSSGKSLGYQLPILSCLAYDSTACAIYLTPTKALGSDQLNAVTQLVQEAQTMGGDTVRSVHPAPYDGDTPSDARSGIREQSRFIFTNPDMLHAGILPNHQRWARLLRHLRFIVIDECHSYRGVFGAGVSLVLRRLLRIAARYGSTPTVILASATSNNPSEHAELLLGRPVHAVTTDSAPTGARTVMLWEPGFLDGVEGEHGAPVRRAASSEAASIMATLIAEGARTLTFVRSRRQAELTALRCAEELSYHGRPDLARRISAYRAGYLAEDRRKIEEQLDNGELLGVASTNALELGIDVGGLDAVVTAGFPGTVASFWQQAGRVGRRGQGSLVTLVARDEPMDTYLVHHPEALLGRPIERTVFNPHNPHILAGHLCCAASEAPLSDAEINALGAQQVAEQLEREGLLRHRRHGWFAVEKPGEPPAHELVSLRGSGSAITIVDETDGRVLGTIEQTRAVSQVHPGAVYLHRSETFVINSLDLDQRLALARPDAPDYSTYARSTTDIRILGDVDKVANPAPGLWVSNLHVEVTDRVTGYVVKAPDGSVLDVVPLQLPPQTLVTRAVAYTIDPLVLTQLGITDIPGALHAAEHAAIGILPLIATCDRWDIGGVSTELHPDTGLPTVFVYDGHPGGAGFADCGYDRFPEWIATTFDAIRSCSCESGCPSCVQSPKCGNGNSPLDKGGALTLLGTMCAMLGVTP